MNILEPVTLIAPINNSTVYCKEPRILFNLNGGDGYLIIYVTISNSKGIFNYTSTRNPDMFSALAFKAYDKVAFVSKDIAVGENKVSIRVYDNEAFATEQNLIFNYKDNLLAFNNESEAITSTKYKYLFTMANETLKAYSKEPIDIKLPVAYSSKIYRNYFSVLNNSLYDLSEWINVNYPGLNRIKTKEIIGLVPISKKIYNNLLNFIIDL